MRRFSFKLVDAFASHALSGNPCAVILGAEGLMDAEMQALAKEFNQSETAFLLPSKNCAMRARYFTPEREIPLAGHPTIALVHAAWESGGIRPTKFPFSLELELRDGPIRVEVDLEEGKKIVRMFQRRPKFLTKHEPARIAGLFGLETHDFLPGAPIQTVSTGTAMLMVPVASHAALRKLNMDIPRYLAYREQSDFFSPHFFCLAGATGAGDTFARHLGVSPDTQEDAFTGSATGCMAAFLWQYGLMPKRAFFAEQGHWMGRPGMARVEAVGEFSDLESVSVSGAAITVVEGQLLL